MSMTEICLVRHGQTDWNFQEIIQGREDIPLNEVGKKQASQSAAALQAEAWDIIISSPLIRAQETAKEIAEATGLQSILLDERFVERNFGEASGKPVATVRELIAEGKVEGMEQDEEIVGSLFCCGKRCCRNSFWQTYYYCSPFSCDKSNFTCNCSKIFRLRHR